MRATNGMRTSSSSAGRIRLAGAFAFVVERMSSPPGRSTRCISCSARSMFGKYSITPAEHARSNDSSPNGNASIFPTWYVMLRKSAARVRAMSSILFDASRALHATEAGRKFGEEITWTTASFQHGSRVRQRNRRQHPNDVIVTTAYKRSPTGPILASVVRVGETVEVRNGSRVRQVPGDHSEDRRQPHSRGRCGRAPRSGDRSLPALTSESV